MQQKVFDAHTHTRKHILFITIPETTPAEHKVRNSIEKLCAELCSFFFVLRFVYSETKNYATGADSWLHNSALIWPRAAAPGVHFAFCYCVLWLFYAFAIAIGYNKSCSTFAPAFFCCCSVAPLGLVHFLYYLFLMSFNYEYNSGRGWRFTGPATQLLS